MAMSLPPPPTAAQDEVELWYVVYDGGEDDQAYAVAVDSEGNIIVTGCSDVSGVGIYYTIKYGVAAAPPAEGGLSRGCHSRHSGRRSSWSGWYLLRHQKGVKAWQG